MGQVQALVVAFPVILSVSLFQLIVVLFLFLFVPVSLFGGLIRLIGYRYQGDGTWRLDLGRLLLNIAKYLIYHLLLFGHWFGLLKLITSKAYLTLDPNNFSHTTPFLLGNQLWLFGLYVLMWVVIIPNLVYWWKTRRGKIVFKPSLGVYSRLLVWNIAIFYLASYFTLILQKLLT